MRKVFMGLVFLTTCTVMALAQTFTTATYTQAFVSGTFLQKAASAAEVEQAIVKLTREWLDAEERHDRAALSRIIADDFQGTAPMGNTVFKDDVLPEEGARSGGLSIDAQVIKARVFGEMAVVMGRGVQKSGEKRQVRFTVVFAKRGESWQMVAGHLSAVPEGR